MTLPLPDPLVNQRAWDDERTGVQRNFETIAQRFPLGPDDLHFGGTVTTLPTGVDEGFEVNYIASASAGVVWRFKYLPTTSATYPWLFIGGPPLMAAEVLTDETRANVAYGDLATVGPSLTLPALAGDFDVTVACRAIADAAAAFEGWMSYAINGGAALDANACSSVSSGQFDGGNITRTSRLTGLTASSAFVCKYRTQVASLYHWSRRQLAITPIRVS